MAYVRRFPDRAAAGRALAPLLDEITTQPRVVLGIPRSGLAAASPIAELLEAPLAVAWVRRLIAPREPDMVLGAVDLDGDVTLNTEAVEAAGMSGAYIAALARRAHGRLRKIWERSPGPDPATILPGGTAIIVDDALTTGITMIAAIRWARRQLARRVVATVPVADARIWSRIAGAADAAVALEERDDGPIAKSEIYENLRKVGSRDIENLFQTHAELSRRPIEELSGKRVVEPPTS